jgi:hypothetical protein
MHSCSIVCSRSDLTNKCTVSIRTGMQVNFLHVALHCPHAGSCRLNSYIARPPRFGRGILCDGGSPHGCLEPCIPGYVLDTSRSRPVCQQQCPSGKASPSHLCSATRTCVRPGELCPRNVMEVPFQCPPPELLIGKHRHAHPQLLVLEAQLLQNGMRKITVV